MQPIFRRLNKSQYRGAFVVAVAALMIVSGCSSDTDRSAAGEEVIEGEVIEAASAESPAQLTGSYATFISLENQLALPNGDPVTITWRVSNTQNKYWDGNSRPDHNPPDGVEGLEQKSGDGPYQVRLEANSNAVHGPEMQFTLTPVVTSKGSNPVNLQSIDFKFYDSWYCPDGGRNCKQDDRKFQPMWEGFVPGDVACGPTPETTFTAEIANQKVTYGFAGSCDPANQPSTFKVISTS